MVLVRDVVPGDRGRGGVLAVAAPADAGLRVQRQGVAFRGVFRAGRVRGCSCSALGLPARGGVALVLAGIGIEHAQGAFTENRMLEARDALANALGVAAGLATRLTPLRDLLLWIDGRRDQS